MLADSNVKPQLDKSSIRNGSAVVSENVTLMCFESMTTVTPSKFEWLKWTNRPSASQLSEFENSVMKDVSSGMYHVLDESLMQNVSRKNPPMGFNVVRGSQLVLVNVTKQQEGLYTCRVSNAVGFETASMYLSVCE